MKNKNMTFAESMMQRKLCMLIVMWLFRDSLQHESLTGNQSGLVWESETEYVDYRSQYSEIIKYDCSGYFFLVISRFRVLRIIHEKIRENCDSTTAMSIFHFGMQGTDCVFHFQYYPNKDALIRRKPCKHVVEDILHNLPEMVWGTQWGCREKYIPIRVTSFYETVIYFPQINVTSLGTLVKIRCHIPILQLEHYSDVQCRMNSFGGYDWHIIPENICGKIEIDPPRISQILILQKSQIYCQLVIFLLYGFIKLAPDDAVYSSIQMGLKLLNDTCPKFAPWEFAAVRLDYLKLIDMILNKLNDHIRMSKAEKSHVWLLDIILVKDALMQDMANRIQDYFAPTEVVFQRSSYVFAYQTPKSTTSVNCSEQYSLSIEGFDGPFYFSCTLRFGYFQFLNSTDYRLVTGLVLIRLLEKQETPHLRINIIFKLPLFQNGLPYECAKLSPQNELSLFSPSSDCRMNQLEENMVWCGCNTPGTFALIQPVSDLSRLRPYFYNHLANSWSVWMIHWLLIGLQIIGQLILLIIRCSKRAQEIYLGNSRSKRNLYFLDLIVQMLFLQTLKLVLQNISIFITDYSYCNLVGLAMNVVVITAGVSNLMIALAVFSLRRTNSPGQLVIQLMCTIYGCLICKTVLLYMFAWGLYVRINCLPSDHVRLMAIPVLVTDALTSCVLIIYWFLRPYQHLSDWIGSFFNVCFTALGFIPTIHVQTPHFYLTPPFERLAQLMVWQACFFLLSRCFLNVDLLRVLWHVTTLGWIKKHKRRDRQPSSLMTKMQALKHQHTGWKQYKGWLRRKSSVKSPSTVDTTSELFNVPDRRRGYFEKIQSDF